MSDTEKLTYLMRSMLRDLERAGDRGISRSNTNKTMCALERRGFVEGTVDPRLNIHFIWKITRAGRDALK